MTFQRPDIKAPLFTVDTFDAHSVVPGYWFVAPYAMISQQSQARNYYQPCQTGPHIYDGNGVHLPCTYPWTPANMLTVCARNSSGAAPASYATRTLATFVPLFKTAPTICPPSCTFTATTPRAMVPSWTAPTTSSKRSTFPLQLRTSTCTS